MSSVEIIVLVLGVIALVKVGDICNAAINGRVHTRAMAQLEEGQRLALCSADEIGNKLMAMLDARTHAHYRQSAGILGKPPHIKCHDPVDGPPEPRVLRSGSGGLTNPDDVLAAVKKQDELERLAQNNRVPIISAPGDYGSREPE